MSNLDNDFNNVPVGVPVSQEPIATRVVADDALYAPQNVPAYVPQPIKSSQIGQKVGIGVLSALAGGALTWAAMHGAGGTTAGTAVAGAAEALHDGTYVSNPHVVNPAVDLAVTLTVEGGRITAVHTNYTTGESPVSDEINAEAVPQLEAEAVELQHANVTMISGATATVDAFRGAMQEALNQAITGVAVAPTADHAEPMEEAAAGAAAGGAAAAGEAAAGALHDGTFQGTNEEVTGDGRTFGHLQVTVTVEGGRITHIESTYPGQGEGESPGSLALNEEAVPKLIAEAIENQSHEVTVISGATATVHSFSDSLQAALNEARG